MARTSAVRSARAAKASGKISPPVQSPICTVSRSTSTSTTAIRTRPTASITAFARQRLRSRRRWTTRISQASIARSTRRRRLTASRYASSPAAGAVSLRPRTTIPTTRRPTRHPLKQDSESTRRGATCTRPTARPMPMAISSTGSTARSRSRAPERSCSSPQATAGTNTRPLVRRRLTSCPSSRDGGTRRRASAKRDARSTLTARSSFPDSSSTINAGLPNGRA